MKVVRLDDLKGVFQMFLSFCDSGHTSHSGAGASWPCTAAAAEGEALQHQDMSY